MAMAFERQTATSNLTKRKAMEDISNVTLKKLQLRNELALAKERTKQEKIKLQSLKVQFDI